MMLPWTAMLRAALAAGLMPRAFWRLSVREWRALTEHTDGLDRTWLADLITRFPDKDT